MMMLVRTVHRCGGGEVGCAALLSRRGRSRTAGCVSRSGFPACAAPAMPTSAATSPAATSLASLTPTLGALTTLDAVTRNLALIAAARLHAGTRLATL